MECGLSIGRRSDLPHLPRPLPGQPVLRLPRPLAEGGRHEEEVASSVVLVHLDRRQVNAKLPETDVKAILTAEKECFHN